MSKTAGREKKKTKLNIGKFLKLVPERTDAVENSRGGETVSAKTYKPNKMAAVLHPGTQHVVVTETKKITEDAVMFTLEPDRNRGTERLAPFEPGSYICLSVNIDGCVYTRPYSLASSPEDCKTGKYEICIKKNSQGTVSKYMTETCAPGACLDVSGPYGEFTYEPLRDAGTVIAVAGGSGITPFRAMAKSIAEGYSDFSLIILYGARRYEEILFRDEEFFNTADKKVRTVYVLSDEEREGFEKGFITKELILKYVPEDSPYSVFICGPQGLYKYMEKELCGLNLKRKYIRTEVFGEIKEPEAEEDFVMPDREEYEVTVRQNGGTVKIKCRFNESLLSAMEKNGIDPPSGCRSGECGFCHSKVISGTYYTPARCDRRRAADRIYGYIHPCCTFPSSDMEIEVPKAPLSR